MIVELSSFRRCLARVVFPELLAPLGKVEGREEEDRTAQLFSELAFAFFSPFDGG